MADLQQTTAFRPFMRQSVMLSQIASRTRENDITDIVGATTSKRYYMLHMVLCQLLFAVVALALLPLMQRLYLLSSVASTRRKLTGTPVMFTGNVTSLTALTLLVTHVIRAGNLTMRVFVSVLNGKDVLTVRFMVLSKVGLSMFLIIPSVIFRTGTFIDFIPLISALFARGAQATSRAFMEEVKRSGKPLQALCTLFLWGIVLGYTVHDKGHSLSGLGCRKQRGASSCITPALYHEPAPQASLRKEYTLWLD